MDIDEFSSDVLVPLATGKTLTIHGPLDADDVEGFLEERRAMPGIAEIGAALQRQMARYLYEAPLPVLDDATIKIAASVHNLCYLLGKDRQDEQKGTLHRIATFTERLATLPPPADAVALFNRHALVGRLRSLVRKDTKVRFWAGHREYRGTTPPSRLLRWQSVRRVREEHVTVDLFANALAQPSLSAIVIALLNASPLTALLRIDRPDPPVELVTAVRWLRVPHVARVVADEYLARGLAAILSPLSAALLSLCNRKGAEDATATLIMFVGHLHLLDLIARPARDREGHLQVIRAYTQGRERAVADGFGMYAAADRVGLGRPSDLAADANLSRNADAYVEACEELVGKRRMLELIGMLTRGVGAHARAKAS